MVAKLVKEKEYQGRLLDAHREQNEWNRIILPTNNYYPLKHMSIYTIDIKIQGRNTIIYTAVPFEVPRDFLGKEVTLIERIYLNIPAFRRDYETCLKENSGEEELKEKYSISFFAYLLIRATHGLRSHPFAV